jgi:hypothetical protein
MTDKKLIDELSDMRWRLIGAYPKLKRGHHRALVAQADDALTRIIADLERERPHLVDLDEDDVPSFLQRQGE